MDRLPPVRRTSGNNESIKLELPGGNRRTFRVVLALSKANSPKFLCETRQAAVKVENLKWRLGLKGFCGVDSVGQSGLPLFWDGSLNVTVLDSCDRYIDAIVVDGSTGVSWRGTFVYGEPRVEKRYLMWQHLERLHAVSDDPWLVCGDYNETLWQHEHFSHSQCGESQMSAFRDTLIVCELEDLGFTGAPYTYDNGQMGERNVRVRLDRACGDEAWRDIFPAAQVLHLATSCSDHCPVLVQLVPEEGRVRNCHHQGTRLCGSVTRRSRKSLLMPERECG